jgi:hypothetical protein
LNTDQQLIGLAFLLRWATFCFEALGYFLLSYFRKADCLLLPVTCLALFEQNKFDLVFLKK